MFVFHFLSMIFINIKNQNVDGSAISYKQV